MDPTLRASLPRLSGVARRTRGWQIGFGLSLLLHAAALTYLLHVRVPPPAADAPAPRMRLVIVLTKPPAPVQALPVPAEVPRPARKPTLKRTERPAAVNPVAGQKAPSQTQAEPISSPAPAADTPVFDMQAARAAARLAAKDDHGDLVMLPRRAASTGFSRDEKVQEDMERARRSDCKTAYAGLGLLALIPLAKDALTGSGCKW